MEEPLTLTELDILYAWYRYIRTKRVEPVRPTLVYYLMTEMLIEYKQQLPDDIRLHRPSEDAVMTIGATSGALSKWRQKWKSMWEKLQKSLQKCT